MTRATVIVAATGTLDVAAARRLADYGDLDDASVARALEQVHIQRWGRADLPGHLHRLSGLAAVIVEQGVVRRVTWPAGQHAEPELITGLQAEWPSGACDLVDWDGQTQRWLIARAAAHDIGLSSRLVDSRPCALGDVLAPAPADHPADAADIEAECRYLFDRAPTPEDDIATRCGARARLWWRAAHARGTMRSANRADLCHRLARLETA